MFRHDHLHVRRPLVLWYSTLKTTATSKKKNIGVTIAPTETLHTHCPDLTRPDESKNAGERGTMEPKRDGPCPPGSSNAMVGS